jgi:alpha-tubulin suppressor-like RCC1 family protein
MRLQAETATKFILASLVASIGCEPFAGVPAAQGDAGGDAGSDAVVTPNDAGKLPTAFVQVVVGTSACNWNAGSLFCRGTQADRETSHSCALRNDGQVYCWGSSKAGRLGSIASGEQLGDPGVPQRPRKVEFGVEVRIRKLAAGSDHTCALADDGKVFCWGYNWNGQLGVPEGRENEPRQGLGVAPVRAVTNAREQVIDVEAGQGITCVRTAVNVYCFGKVNDGEGAFHLGGQVTALSIGWKTTCALEGGKVSCAGDNVSNVVSSSREPFIQAKTQLPLPDTADFLDVTVGYTHACARTAAKVYCWGNNAFGQIGTELPRTSTLSPEGARSSSAFATSGGGNIGLLVAGAGHTCWTDSGRVACMGANQYGQSDGIL